MANILVFGSDLITVGSLRHLVKCSAVKQLELITPTSNKKSAPIQFCAQHNIKFHCLPKDTDFKLTNWNIPSTQHWDIGILVSFGYLVPNRIISAFPNGMINVHPSLLPQYVGSAPIPYSLLYGDKVTGVSIIDVEPKLDAGNILQQEMCVIEEQDTYDTLSHKLADLGGKLLCDTLVNLKKYREISIQQSENLARIQSIYRAYNTDSKLHEQDEKASKEETFQLIKTRKIDKNMSYIDWRLSPRQIFNRHRAINGLLRNSRSILGTQDDDKSLLILIDELAVYNKDELQNDEEHALSIFNDNYAVGSIVYSKEKDVLFVKCGDGESGDELLGIKKLRIAPSLSSQHLANFDDFVHEFGHFISHCDSDQYKKQYAKRLKNHF